MTQGKKSCDERGGTRRIRSADSGRPHHFQLELVPGVRDRVQARLACMGVSTEKAASYVAGITQRAAQSVRRWLGPDDPGLPDLESFARLCVGLGCSADELIGLSNAAQGQPLQCAQLIEVANCIHDITGALTRRGPLGVPMRVPGDEMAPRLKAGDLVFVDTTVTCLSGNGVYALTCDDGVLIRRVEHRLGRRAILKCDNKAYGDCEWMGTASAARRGLKILGKVHATLTVSLL
ncbi:S24 family peptidase [Paucibacter sp. O1-1]|nr:S24 family peptidase [Paucibacter sp. O1-1]MDA3825007.1 S24 family peptidase [Paucibacter sp. O1-1]